MNSDFVSVSTSLWKTNYYICSSRIQEVFRVLFLDFSFICLQAYICIKRKVYFAASRGKQMRIGITRRGKPGALASRAYSHYRSKFKEQFLKMELSVSYIVRNCRKHKRIIKNLISIVRSLLLQHQGTRIKIDERNRTTIRRFISIRQ